MALESFVRLQALLAEIRDASDDPKYWEEVMQARPRWNLVSRSDRGFNHERAGVPRSFALRESLHS